MITAPVQIEMEIETDPAEIEAARKRHAQFDRNFECMKAVPDEVWDRHRGKVLCFAGGEYFVGATATEAVDRAKTAHPDDQGWFTRYIPRERLIRIYAI